MANGGDIIIKGGSVDIDFDDNVYPHDPSKPRNHQGKQKITRVTVADENNTLKYDSEDQEAADPTRWTISVYCTATGPSEQE